MSAPISRFAVVPAATPFALRVVILFVCLTACFLMALPLKRLSLRIPLNYNEGWNAYQVERAMSSQPLYPPSDALTTNNYPPLSFYVVGMFSRAVGDHVIAGRLVAMASFVVVTFNVALFVFAGTGSKGLATYAAALFLLFAATRWLDYLGMADPQWLAHAVALSGVSAILYRPSRGVAFGAGLLVGTALFIKHSVVPLPIALVVHMVFYPSRLMSAWLAGFVTSVLSIALACTAYFGVSMWEAILANPREGGVWYAAEKVDAFLTPAMPLAAALPLFIWLSADWRRPSFPILYAAAALCWACFGLSGDGVNYNMTFDVVISLCTLVGLAAGATGHKVDFEVMARLRATVVVSTAFALLLPAPFALLRQRATLEGLDGTRREAQADINRIRNTIGRVACEKLELCYWAGKPWEIDIFNTSQKLRAGVIPHEVLTRALASHQYVMVQSGVSGSVPKFLWMPPSVNEVLSASYAPVYQSSFGVLSMAK